MKLQSTKSMKATTLTGILIGIIILIVAGVGVANWQLQSMLKTEITATSAIKQEAAESSENLTRAQALESYMKEHAADVQRAAGVVAESKIYQYQNQIIEDVTRYATAAGVNILEFSFPDQKQQAKKEGPNSIPVKLSLAQPIGYAQYLTFLKLIEQNLTKMQITEVSASPNDVDYSVIDAPSVGLEVYVN